MMSRPESNSGQLVGAGVQLLRGEGALEPIILRAHGLKLLEQQPIAAAGEGEGGPGRVLKPAHPVEDKIQGIALRHRGRRRHKRPLGLSINRVRP